MTALPGLLDRSLPPAPGRIRPFKFPSFVRHRLDNGLTVFAAHMSDVPLVSLELVAPAGAQHDPPGRSGLATLTAALLDEGTAGRTALEIAAKVERLGGYLTTGADWDVGYLATGTLSHHLRANLDLLFEVATSPTFPEREVDRLRRQRLAEILRWRHDPGARADLRLTEVIYEGSVYASSLLGSEESVAALEREDVERFFRRHYTPGGTALIVVGDLDPEVVVRTVETVFGGHPAQEVPPSPEIRPTRLPGVVIDIVDRPGASQTELRLGHAGVRRRDPDYPALVFMNTLLGGKFTSRINLNLRERHGFTYGAQSRFIARLGPGPFLVSTAVATETTGAAVRETLSELRRIREELAEPSEIEDTRSYLIGIFPYTVQTIADLAKRLETLAIFDLPDDYYDGYVARLTSITREQVMEVARRHLDPAHLSIVAVGPADQLEEQLRGVGEVRVVAREAVAQPA